MKKIIFLIGIFVNLMTEQAFGKLITHKTAPLKALDILEYKEKIKQKKDTSLPVEVELELLNQLTKFELGRFLLANKGLNGYWTAYLILHGPKKKNLHPLEDWLLHHAPAVKATQERFKIFREVLQNNLKDNIKIASIPCGLMDDLLGLNFEKAKNVELIGMDLDPKSLAFAKKNAKKHGYQNVRFHQKEAWRLDVNTELDILVSNGLNIYEKDDEKVVELYRQFYKALKPNGILVTSFLTPPPAFSPESTWRNVNQEDALKQKALFTDIIGVHWQSFRTESLTRSQLQEAGFEVLEVIYDVQGMFPTIVAKKVA